MSTHIHACVYTPIYVYEHTRTRTYAYVHPPARGYVYIVHVQLLVKTKIILLVLGLNLVDHGRGQPHLCWSGLTSCEVLYAE